MNFKLCRLKTRYSCEKVKLRHFGKKHGILAKSRHSQHLTKITVSVISVFPWLSTVPNDVRITAVGEDPGTEQWDAADGLSAVSWQEWEWHTTYCTGNTGGSPACHHGQHDCWGLSGPLLSHYVTKTPTVPITSAYLCSDLKSTNDVTITVSLLTETERLLVLCE